MTNAEIGWTILCVLIFYVGLIWVSIKPPKEVEKKKFCKTFTLVRPIIHIKTRRCLNCGLLLHQHNHVDSGGTRNYYCFVKPKK